MKKIIALVIIISAAVYYFNNSSNTHSDQVEHDHKTSPAAPKVEVSHDHAHAHVSPVKESKKIKSIPVKVVEIPNDEQGKSLQKFSTIIADLSSDRIEIEELKDYLTDFGLNIDVANDENESTGSMSIIRTRNTLPGTRYFHAQVFKDENGESFIQHISFEYRPGENAFEEAIAVAKKQFGLKKNPDVSRDGFVSWSTKSGHVIWVKKMEKEDLQNDPFNAYTDADIGTIKVAKELEIH